MKNLIIGFGTIIISVLTIMTVAALNINTINQLDLETETRMAVYQTLQQRYQTSTIPMIRVKDFDGKYLKPGTDTSTTTVSNKIYAYLCTDGELILSSKTIKTNKSAKKNYGQLTISESSAPSWTAEATNIKTVTIQDIIKPISCYRWFYNCSNLTKISGLEKLDTSECRTMTDMFYTAKNIKELNLSNFDLNKTTSMNNMFYGCTSLSKIYIGTKWKIINDASTTNMYTQCSAKSIDTNSDQNYVYTNYKINNDETMINMFYENLSMLLKKQNKVSVKIVGASYDAGLLSVNVSYTYENMGHKRTIDTTQTVIREGYTK